MNGASVGAVLGALCGLGVALVLLGMPLGRRPSLEERVVPYLGRVSAVDSRRTPGRPRAEHLVRTVVLAAGHRLDRVLGGSASLRRRLERAGGRSTLEQLRLEQVAWGAAGFCGAFALLLVLLGGGSSISPVAALGLCLGAAAAGVLAREQVLDRAVRVRADRIAGELPVVAELLALAVGAGEGAAGALGRVVRVCGGELSIELARVLDDARTGQPLPDALTAMAVRLEVPPVTRFVDTFVLAIERGTPLSDVLRAQAADGREQRRRALMESAGRREIAMLLPVVFLILPVTVVFALFPGFYGLNLSVT